MTPVSWEEVISKTTKLSESLVELMQEPPEFSREGSWMEGDRWLELLEGYMQSNNLTTQAFYR